MSENKKFELSPSLSIIIAGVIIAGAIVVTHFYPSGAAVVQNDQGTGTPTFQQTMGPATYASIAKSLGADMTKYAACVDAKTDQAKIDAESAEGQQAGGQGTPFTVIYDTKTGKSIPVSGALPYDQIKAAIAALPTQGEASTIKPPSASDHIIGSPTAPIVLVEYSDFQCPYCKMIHTTLKQIVSESNGQIAWAYRQFPLYQIHPQAENAANASECIYDQLGNTGFWKFANTIFET
jgi:protein-disulfide isomerase